MKLHRRHIRGQVDVDSSPEGGRKAAPKHDVHRSFLHAIADLTNSVMQHVPPFQVFPALNSVLDEEPGEELHSWGARLCQTKSASGLVAFRVECSSL